MTVDEGAKRFQVAINQLAPLVNIFHVCYLDMNSQLDQQCNHDMWFKFRAHTCHNLLSQCAMILFTSYLLSIMEYT